MNICKKYQKKDNFLYEELNSKLEVILITKDNLDYEGNITVLPSYLAKGLEFDCVIIMNENDFNKNNPLDLKLLYVSKTRALHKLYIKK
ncbi:MAG: ATP-binding domain-containing protein [Bacilli bacterium]|nr:ATP-binding domain-containing protein [Bacilli bacterium]